MKNRSLFVLSRVAVLPRHLRWHVVLPRLRIKQFRDLPRQISLRDRRVALRKPSHRFSRDRIRAARSKSVQAVVKVCTSEEDAVDWHNVANNAF